MLSPLPKPRFQQSSDGLAPVWNSGEEFVMLFFLFLVRWALS